MSRAPRAAVLVAILLMVVLAHPAQAATERPLATATPGDSETPQDPGTRPSDGTMLEPTESPSPPNERPVPTEEPSQPGDDGPSDPPADLESPSSPSGLLLSAGSGRPGDVVAVSGSGYRCAREEGRIRLELTWDGTAVAELAEAGDDGLTGSFTVPAGAAPGQHRLAAWCVVGDWQQRLAVAPFTVAPPPVVASPAAAPVAPPPPPPAPPPPPVSEHVAEPEPAPPTPQRVPTPAPAGGSLRWVEPAPALPPEPVGDFGPVARAVFARALPTLAEALSDPLRLGLALVAALGLAAFLGLLALRAARWTAGPARSPLKVGPVLPAASWSPRPEATDEGGPVLPAASDEAGPDAWVARRERTASWSPRPEAADEGGPVLPAASGEAGPDAWVARRERTASWSPWPKAAVEAGTVAGPGYRWPWERGPGDERRSGILVTLLVLLVATLLYGLLDRVGDRAAGASLAIVGGVVVALVLVNLTVLLPATLYAHVVPRERQTLRVRPLVLLVAALLVGGSLLVGLEPGLLYGVLAATVVLDGRRLSPADGGRAVLLGTGALGLVTLGAWLWWSLGVDPVVDPRSMTFGTMWLDSALSATVVAGVQTLVIGLLPLPGLDGGRLARWSPAVWALTYTPVLWAFLHLLVAPDPAWVDRPRPSPTIALALVAIAVAGVLARRGLARLRPPAPVGDQHAAP